MASIENKTSNSSAPGQGEALSNGYSGQYHPAYPTMRSGGSESDHSSHSQGSRSRMYRPSDPSKPALDMKDAKYAPLPKGARAHDKMATRMPNNFPKPCYRQNDGRNYESFQPAERREGSSRSDDRRSEVGNQYNSYSRDGPSPGRGYTQNYTNPEHMRQPNPHPQSAEGMHIPPKQATPSPFRATSTKRKAHELHNSPGGPRLISNQSSDDSINAMFPSKRVRSNNGFSENVLMKSFTPLSPIRSRTFSRDEQIDMSRFIDSRGSAEGMRIFQSWSSGNGSPQDDHSPIDVRLCYNDWHGPTPPGRRPSRNWNERMPGIKERDGEHQQQQLVSRSRTSGSRSSRSRTPPTKPSRGPGAPPERWALPPQNYNGRGPNAESEQHPPSSKNYRGSSSSQFCQPLHPEDRFGPFNEQLARRVPEYGHEDPGRYWQGEGPPYQHFPPGMRGGPEEMMKSQGRRGTPPITNTWNHNDEFVPNHQMYEHSQMTQRPPKYESWSDNRQYADPYGNSRVPVEQPREYTGRHLQSASIESGPDGSATAIRTANGILLLALPEDKISLSETLCIVRENIEVFIATEADVKAPAPGRKRPVVVGQVGLRCIHCRVATHQSEKVKRAVCFPSSIKRIYRTVIDMKLDHFKACRFVPVEFKMKLEQLKATNARSTGTTMQYFVQASKRMGMVDGGHGIRICKETEDSKNNVQIPQQIPKVEQTAVKLEHQQVNDIRRRSLPNVQPGVSFSLSMDLSLSGASAGSSSKMDSASSQAGSMKDDTPTFEGKTLLASPEDKSALSPLRCFLRENVYAFSASPEDIAVRTPTTFSVVVGQVGIACVHCHHLPAKQRSNRAVCFPFSIGRIYQSVADIQRFHLSECKMVPPSVKHRFFELQKASTKGSKGLATRQYWISSAKKLGLADTSSGIRFTRDPSAPLEKAASLDILAQVATDVTTAARPLVLDEDNSQIAGFIYLVMKQLQPCRFTEADRNKRRLKDVGCIGVECKHCAGQVDGRKFFWSSVNAVESNFVSVHTHMMECKAIPLELKEELAHLKTLRKEHTSKLKTGSQKSFFARVWQRLHAEGDNIPAAPGHKKQANPSDVPPQLAMSLLMSDSHSSSPGVSAFNDGTFLNVSSPNNSFSGSMTPPHTALREHHTLQGSPPNSDEKFHMSPLAMSSPSTSPSTSDRPEGCLNESKINVEYV